MPINENNENNENNKNKPGTPQPQGSRAPDGKSALPDDLPDFPGGSDEKGT